MVRTSFGVRSTRTERVAIGTLLALLLVVSVATGTAAAQSAPDCSTVSYNGAGTEANPYEIGNLDELQCIGAADIETEKVNDFVQVDGIDSFRHLSWNFGGEINQVSPSGTPFREFSYGSPHLQVDPKEVNESMENIDSTLVQLIEASDKEEFAERNSIDYRNGRAQVVVEMGEGFTFPEGYNTTNELNYTGQGENLAQAYVHVNDLVSLSNETGIEYVRLPLKGSPSRESEQEDQKQTGGTNNSNENQDEEGNQDAEGLTSLMGGIVPALIIILTAAYGRKRL